MGSLTGRGGRPADIEAISSLISPLRGVPSPDHLSDIERRGAYPGGFSHACRGRGYPRFNQSSFFDHLFLFLDRCRFDIEIGGRVFSCPTSSCNIAWAKKWDHSYHIRCSSTSNVIEPTICSLTVRCILACWQVAIDHLIFSRCISALGLMSSDENSLSHQFPYALPLRVADRLHVDSIHRVSHAFVDDCENEPVQRKG